MASRSSRKRGRRRQPGTPPVATASRPGDDGPTPVATAPRPGDDGPTPAATAPRPRDDGPTPVATASRPRDEGPASVATASRPRDDGPAPAATAPARPKPRGRSDERNAAVRATLTPLEPGERPWSLKIAVLLAALIGAGDLITVLVAGEFKVGGARAGAGGVIVFSVLMLVCAVGMWQKRYWAVLGFQAILAFVILFFSLLGLRAANLLAVVASVVVVGGGGWLFYKLVRVLSRIQMPKYPGS